MKPYFWFGVLKKTLQSPLNCKEIQPVCPKGDQSWVFTGRADVEAETLVLRLPDAKSWLICKDPDAGTDWGQEEKGTTEDEMVGWQHRLNGHEFGWTPGVGDGQGGLVCCGSWGRKESDTTEWLNWTKDLGLSFVKLELCGEPSACLWWKCSCGVFYVRILSGHSVETVVSDCSSRRLRSKASPRGWARPLFLYILRTPVLFICSICAVLCLVAQSCLTLFDPMDCSLPGSSVHGDSIGVGCHALLL